MPIRSTIPQPVEKTEALQRLARAGDPSAFLIVFDAPLRETFLALIQMPIDAVAEPLKVFVAFSRKMYQEFQESSDRTIAADWYADRRKKYLARFLDTAAEPIPLESGDSDTYEPIRERLSLMLQREYGKQNRLRRSPPTVKSFLGTIITSPWFFIPVIGLVASLSGLCALQIWWHSAGIGISVAFTNRVAERHFSFPLAVNPQTLAERLFKKIGVFAPVNGSASSDSIPAVAPVVSADSADTVAAPDSVALQPPAATLPPAAAGSVYPSRPMPVPSAIPALPTTRLINPVMQPTVKPVTTVPLTTAQVQIVHPDTARKAYIQSVQPVPTAEMAGQRDSAGP